jgi:hypothetical protein
MAMLADEKLKRTGMMDINSMKAEAFKHLWFFRSLSWKGSFMEMARTAIKRLTLRRKMIDCCTQSKLALGFHQPVLIHQILHMQEVVEMAH